MSQDGGIDASESVYQRTERVALARTTFQERPHAILLGGQPGSGKSELSKAAVFELVSRGGSVTIDPDAIRKNIPAYAALSRSDPQHAADRTQAEARTWTSNLLKAAVDGKRNLVIDGTMRNPVYVRELSAHLKEQGYTVEARVIAVSPELSMARARLRFEKNVAMRGVGRFVNPQQHDQAYAGLAQSVRALEQGKLVDSVRVYDGSQQEIYVNQQVRGRWQHEPVADQVLVREQTRPWTHEERQQYVATLSDVLHLARQREGIQENVVYTVGRQTSQEAKNYSGVHETVRAFRAIEPKDYPYILRTERLPSGQETQLLVGRVMTQDASGKVQHVAHISGADPLLKQAYVQAISPDADRRGIVIGDTRELAAVRDSALRQLEQGDTPQRALAFDRLRPEEAMGRYPELDATYKQLLGAQNMSPSNGRGASIAVMSEIQGGLPAGLRQVQERFGNAVHLRILDNTSVQQRNVYAGWDAIHVLEKEGSREEIRERLVAALEQGYRERRYNEGFYRQAAGKSPEVGRDGKSSGRTWESSDRRPQPNGAGSHLQGEGPEKDALSAAARPLDPLSRDEALDTSRKTITQAARQQNLIVRDGDSFDRGIKGEVVAGSSHHVLLRVSDQVGLVYGRDRLDRLVEVGERVSIEPGQQQHRVMAQEQAIAREPGRDPGRER